MGGGWVEGGLKSWTAEGRGGGVQGCRGGGVEV